LSGASIPYQEVDGRQQIVDDAFHENFIVQLCTGNKGLPGGGEHQVALAFHFLGTEQRFRNTQTNLRGNRKGGRKIKLEPFLVWNKPNARSSEQRRKETNISKYFRFCLKKHQEKGDCL